VRQFFRKRREARQAARLQAEREAYTRDEFARVKEEAEKIGGMVCGAIRPDGQPVYWISKREVPDEELERKAFEMAYDRPITYGEELLRKTAEARKATR
jgi:hypothetical protein